MLEAQGLRKKTEKIQKSFGNPEKAITFAIRFEKNGRRMQAASDGHRMT